MIQGLMSSEGGTSAGGVTGDVTGLELAEISQQSHVSVMGHNKYTENINTHKDNGPSISMEQVLREIPQEPELVQEHSAWKMEQKTML